MTGMTGGGSGLWQLGSSTVSGSTTTVAAPLTNTTYSGGFAHVFGQPQQLMDPTLYYAFLKWQADQATAEAERNQPPLELIAQRETALETMEAMLLYVKQHPDLDDHAAWTLELREAHRRVKAFHAMLSAKVLSERLDG